MQHPIVQHGVIPARHSYVLAAKTRLVSNLGTGYDLGMRVIARSTLVKFCHRLPKGQQVTAEAAMAEWYATISKADWKTFADVRATFNSADYVASGKIVFDVGGNKYRIVALLGFRTQRAFILFVGTHAEYDRMDVAKL